MPRVNGTGIVEPDSGGALDAALCADAARVGDSMAVRVTCPGCGAAFRVRSERIGRRGRCPHCRSLIDVPAPHASGQAEAVSSAGATPSDSNGQADQARDTGDANPAETMRLILKAFQGEFPPVRVGLGYRLAIVLVALAMLTLPLIYLGLIGLVGYVLYYHATEHMFLVRGWRASFIVYVAPLLAGGLLLLFMLKPLLSRSVPEERCRRLKFRDEPLLFSFVERLCQAVRAPMPKFIEVDGQVNAAAGYQGGFGGLLRKNFVLRIGLPLVAGLNARQFGGVLAHELGHFSQGHGMALQHVIDAINRWLFRAVYERDSWDVWLNDLDDHDIWGMWIPGRLARVCIGGVRLILLGLMLTGRGLSCFLGRQREFAADLYAIRLAGSQTFAEMVHRTRCLGHADLAARRILVQHELGGAIPVHYPAFVLLVAEGLSGEFRQQLAASITLERTSMFATHPSDRDRISAAQLQAAPGIFRLEIPSTRLFYNFDKLAVAVSPKLYRRLLSKPVELSDDMAVSASVSIPLRS